MPRLNSTGQCALCGETFSKNGIARHLQTCRRDHAPKASSKAKPRQTFLLAVEGRDLPMYWMYLELPTDLTLAKLDRFLRDTWLECCGHLSAFTIEGERYDVLPAHDFWGWGPPEKNMKHPLAGVLRPRLKCYHEYDFGTTTELALKMISEQEGIFKGKAIRVLARNDPPDIPCGKCGQPATQVCVECMYSGQGWLCEEHAEKHRHPEMFLPVVNSPRVGMCGYTGPLED